MSGHYAVLSASLQSINGADIKQSFDYEIITHRLFRWEIGTAIFLGSARHMLRAIDEWYIEHLVVSTHSLSEQASSTVASEHCDASKFDWIERCTNYQDTKQGRGRPSHWMFVRRVRNDGVEK